MQWLIENGTTKWTCLFIFEHDFKMTKIPRCNAMNENDHLDFNLQFDLEFIDKMKWMQNVNELRKMNGKIYGRQN